MRRCRIGVVTFGEWRGYWPVIDSDSRGRVYPRWYATRLARRLNRRHFGTYIVERIR